MNEKEQTDLDKQQAGRETFRDNVSPATSSREPDVQKTQDSPIPEQNDEEPYAIEEDNTTEYEDKPLRKFFNSLLKPTQKPQETPISYAGWKPSGTEA